MRYEDWLMKCKRQLALNELFRQSAQALCRDPT